MYKKILFLIIAALLCLSLAACGLPEEKIATAQAQYTQLADIHNQVVEAHKNVEDNSLDEELTKLQSRASDMGAFNLAEMEEEEIDELIRDMDSMISEYEGYLAQLSNIKGAEEEAVLTPIVITLMNRTESSFLGLRLYEQASSGAQVNVLEDMEGFAPGQYLAGLTVMRDVDNTPWVISLTDANGTEHEVVLEVGEFAEGNISLALFHDGESGELTTEIIEAGTDDGEDEPAEEAESEGDKEAAPSSEGDSDGQEAVGASGDDSKGGTGAESKTPQ